MKLYMIILVSLLSGPVWAIDASSTSQEVITEFHWTVEEGGWGINPYLHLAVVWPDKSPITKTLRTLGPAVVSRITSQHYAILGKLKYRDVAAGSYLEMLSYFAPEKEGGEEAWYYSRTLADAGPMAKLEGTDEGRDFLLPFDATAAKTKLIRIVFNLHLGGPGSVELSDVKLVQYSDSPAQAEQAPSIPGMKILADLPVEKYLSSAQDQKDLFENWSHLEVAGVGRDGEFKVSYPKESDGTTGILVEHMGESIGKFRIALLTVPQELAAQIPGNCYGIAGEVWYQDLKNGALCMDSIYSQRGLAAPLDQWFQQMEGPQFGGKSEAMGHIQGTRDWGNFYLGFNRGNGNFSAQHLLKRIIFNILWDDPETSSVHLRHLKLVQYPEPPAPPVATASPPPAPMIKSESSSVGFDRKSFFLGVAATLLATALVGIASFLLGRIRRRRHHERELRRIASLDS